MEKIPTVSNVILEVGKPPQQSFEFVKSTVFDSVEQELVTTEDLERVLANWWCRHYSKPYKCQEVLEYTLEELMVEFLELSYFQNPEKFKKDLKVDTRTTDEKEDEEWLKRQMGQTYVSDKDQKKKLKTQDQVDLGDFKETHMTFGD